MVAELDDFSLPCLWNQRDPTTYFRQSLQYPPQKNLSICVQLIQLACTIRRDSLEFCFLRLPCMLVSMHEKHLPMMRENDRAETSDQTFLLPFLNGAGERQMWQELPHLHRYSICGLEELSLLPCSNEMLCGCFPQASSNDIYPDETSIAILYICMGKTQNQTLP